MENETQNQDTQAAPQQQQPVVEEAQAAPEQAMDATQAATSEVVHDAPPGVPQQQEEEQQQGIAVGEPDPASGGDIVEDELGGWDDDWSWDREPSDTEVVTEIPNQGEGWDWDSEGVPEYPTSGGDIAEDGLGGWDDDFSPDFFDRPEEPTPGGYDDMLGISKEDIEGPSSDTDGDGASDLDEAREDATPGGYDGSGIAGGLGIDYEDDTQDGEESDERSPDVVGEEEDASEAQGDFTDADYQEVLDDLDNGNLDDVREFLESLGHSDDDDTEVAPQHAPGVPDEDGKLVDEGISIEDIVGGKEKVEEGLEDVNNNSTEEYTYDEEAYEDAEDALKDLKHALKHGDEEDRAEALEHLQGYLGGFDKDNAEDQDGTETREDQIPSVSENDSDGDGMEDAKEDSDSDGVLDLTDSDDDGDGLEDVIDFDADGNGIGDWEELDSDGDGIKDAKEDSDGDGMLDWLDSDSDGDGIDDWLVSDFDGNGIEYGKEDSDGDGIENAKDDSDGDGLYDWQDSDSDGNGIDDFEEIFDDPYEFTCF